MAERGDDRLLDAEAARMTEVDADEWKWAQNASADGGQSAPDQAAGQIGVETQQAALAVLVEMFAE